MVKQFILLADITLFSYAALDCCHGKSNQSMQYFGIAYQKVANTELFSTEKNELDKMDLKRDFLTFLFIMQIRSSKEITQFRIKTKKRKETVVRKHSFKNNIHFIQENS